MSEIIDQQVDSVESSPLLPPWEVYPEPVNQVDVDELRAHEMTKNYPSVTGDEGGSLLASIARQGILQPVTVWRDGDEKYWVIDGRTRLNAFKALVREGRDVTEEGRALILPMEEFVGTTSQAFSYVHEKNFARRHMSSSQRAAVIIRERLAQAKYLKKDGLSVEGVYQGKEESLNQFAERLGKESGTNRQYIYNCARIAEIDPKFLDHVVSGDKVVNDVLKAALRKQQGLDPWPTASEEGGAESSESSNQEESPVKDGLKRVVDPKHAKFFLVRDKVRDAVKALKKAQAEVEAIAAGDGGDHFDGPGMSQSISSVVRDLVNSQPHVLCPKCSGTGKEVRESGGQKKCSICGGAGFISKAIHGALPPELKDVVAAQGEPG